jgi:hypothetical protein
MVCPAEYVDRQLVELAWCCWCFGDAVDAHAPVVIAVCVDGRRQRWIGRAATDNAVRSAIKRARPNCSSLQRITIRTSVQANAIKLRKSSMPLRAILSNWRENPSDFASNACLVGHKKSSSPTVSAAAINSPFCIRPFAWPRVAGAGDLVASRYAGISRVSCVHLALNICRRPRPLFTGLPTRNERL